MHVDGVGHDGWRGYEQEMAAARQLRYHTKSKRMIGIRSITIEIEVGEIVRRDEIAKLNRESNHVCENRI